METQGTNQILNTTIPVWGIITLVAAPTAVGIWRIIQFYFRNKEIEKSVENQTDSMYELESDLITIKKELETRLDNVRKEFEVRLENHKKDTDREFERLHRKLDTQGTILTEVKTLVELLVGDKIKK